MRNFLLLIFSIISFSVVSFNVHSKPTLTASNNCNAAENQAKSAAELLNQLIYVACRDTNNTVKVYVFKTNGSVDALNVHLAEELPANDQLVVELNNIASHIDRIYLPFGSQVTEVPIPDGVPYDSAWDVLTDPTVAAAIIADKFNANRNLNDDVNIINSQIKRLQEEFNLSPLKIDGTKSVVIKFPDGTASEFEVFIKSDVLSGKLSIGLRHIVSKDASGKFINPNVKLLLAKMSDSLITEDNIGDISAFIHFITLYDVKVNFVDNQLDPDLKGTIGEVCKVTHITKQGIKVPEVICTNG